MACVPPAKGKCKMGYTTEFDGSFSVTPPLKPEHVAYLTKFSETRRMKRDATQSLKMSDPVREAVGLPVGEEGAYFVGGGGFFGQDEDSSVLAPNRPPTGQPGLWCKWIPTEDGSSIEWDGNEKFYDYIEWIQYLITHFTKPWGYTVNGSVEWGGEERGDTGIITVTDNTVKAAKK